MNYQKFLQHLPGFYENWGSESVRPKSSRFHQILGCVRGMTSANVMQLLNWAVACMEPDEVYCEIGSFQGATLIGALVDNSPRVGLAVDDFSEFDPSGQNLRALTHNLAQFDLKGRVFFHNQTFEEFFLQLRQSKIRIGVYLYDGAHDYRSQLLGLLFVRLFLADQALIIVDDSNCSAVKQADWDFIATHSECRMLLDLPTPGNCHCTFWNGIHVLAWDRQTRQEYDWSVFQRARQQGLLESLYALQSLTIRRRGQMVEIGTAQ